MNEDVFNSTEAIVYVIQSEYVKLRQAAEILDTMFWAGVENWDKYEQVMKRVEGLTRLDEVHDYLSGSKKEFEFSPKDCLEFIKKIIRNTNEKNFISASGRKYEISVKEVKDESECN